MSDRLLPNLVIMTSRGNQNDEEDLDTFLTTMESKLRGPFSSLDLAKAVTTNALRGSHTPKQYLQNVSKVLARTDKVIQARVLIGLLGLEANDGDTNNEIFHILQQAQEAPTHETWVRTTAGLIQGIMFQEETDVNAHAHANTESIEATHFAFHRSCRGPEATQLLDQLCDEVCTNVRSAQERSSENGGKPSHCPDLNASFVPFRYSLLPEPFIQALMPECSYESKNPHFQVNTKASILLVDQQLEAKRVKEELEHQGPVLMKTKMSGSAISGTDDGTAPGSAPVLPPGFRPTRLVPSASQKTTKTPTNMFMPKKTNTVMAQRQHQQTVLRRKGAAQSLVNKTKVKNRITGTAAGTTAAPTSASTTATAAAARFRAKAGGSAALGRSKMKMIDVNEVNSLTKEHAARDVADSDPRLSKKRRIMEAAALHKNGAAAKKSKKDGTPTETSHEQSQHPQGSQTAQSPSAKPMAPGPTSVVAEQSNGGSEEEWRIMLKERSNKLSDDDRSRVQQFFQSRHNPTPGESLVKMKLHEQRSTDPETGQAVKETFYLELDYSNFSSKQSRKVKRY